MVNSGRFKACSNFPEYKNPNQKLRKIEVHRPTCKKGEVVKRKPRKSHQFTDANAIRIVNSSHGINLLHAVVQNVNITWLRNGRKKRSKLNVVIVIIKKNHNTNQLS